MHSRIFVTAHDEFAIKAFETHALDYLLKPVKPERLAKTLKQLEKRRPSKADESLKEIIQADRFDEITEYLYQARNKFCGEAN